MNAKRSHEVRKQSAPHTHTHKEESLLQSFSSWESQSSAQNVRVAGGARPSAGSPTAESQAKQRGEPSQQGTEIRPQSPACRQAKSSAKYEAMEANDGKAQANGRERRLGRDPEGNGAEKAQTSGVVSGSNGVRPGDEWLVRGQAEQQRMESLAGVLRSIGLAASKPATINGERHDANSVAGMAEINGEPRSYKSNGRFYASLGSPEQHAWEEHLDGSKRDAAGGWMYPSRWPPAANP